MFKCAALVKPLKINNWWWPKFQLKNRSTASIFCHTKNEKKCWIFCLSATGQKNAILFMATLNVEFWNATRWNTMREKRQCRLANKNDTFSILFSLLAHAYALFFMWVCVMWIIFIFIALKLAILWFWWCNDNNNNNNNSNVVFGEVIYV